MKYMGSKRVMLQNGLAKTLLREASDARRVVDLFCGSSVVTWFLAEHTNKVVFAADLQLYAVSLARAVLSRTGPLDPTVLQRVWLDNARQEYAHSLRLRLLQEASLVHVQSADEVLRLRDLCEQDYGNGDLWSAYGGHYFSADQALKLDILTRLIPKASPVGETCVGALIIATMRCVAAPGHTAQPFQPTTTALPYILEAWSRDPFLECQRALDILATKHANQRGNAEVGDATDIAATLSDTDLVFLDPPYSGVQYSRFYHVLETVARGQSGSVAGVGRYPPISERPQSSFSNKSESLQALTMLLEMLAQVKAKTVLTFPEGACSNGLSGGIVADVARGYFDVKRETVNGQFSTLGGNNQHRAARQSSREMILVLRPKTR